MKEFCENHYCESPAVEEVPVSVRKASDQQRSLCRPCHEAYTWGVQHGKRVSQQSELWLVAIADRGLVAYIKSYGSEPLAMKGVASYLRTHHGYRGQLTREEVNAWLEENDERLSVEVICQKRISDARQFHDRPTLARADRFLEKDRFILLAKNNSDPSQSGPYEAWAYEGLLDFSKAFPNCFGFGVTIVDSLEALNHQLDDWAKGQSDEVTRRDPGGEP
jgi:hypothetical protein